MRRQAGQQQSGGGSSAQRQLAQEVEEAARRLEQLSREQQRPDLAEAARDLQQAADAMRQAAANGQNTGAQASAALDKLREAQRQLEREQTGRSDRDLQNALREAEELAAEQKDVVAEVQGLDSQSPVARQGRTQALADRKEAMDAKVGELQKDLERLANDTRRDERDASRRLDEAAGSIRDKKVREKIRYTRGTLQQPGSQSQYARAMEDDISSNLDALKDKIGEAAAAMGSQSRENA